MPDYFFSETDLRYLTNEDICTMYDNGVPVVSIAKRLSGVIGKSTRATLPIVQEVIYKHLCPPAHVSNEFTPAVVPCPFPRSWSVGEFMCRRY